MRQTNVVSLDVSHRPAFHALQGGLGNCNHTPAEILRMMKAKIKEFDNEQLAAALMVMEQEHILRVAAEH